ncbi:MAG: hypothetical protein R2762_04320 [Bryobacteraceae bacterium]
MSVLEAVVNEDPALATLDPGERSAILLGITLEADLILTMLSLARLAHSEKACYP